MSANEKMPRQANKYVYIGIDYINWKNSLQPCEISESEFEKLSNYLKALPCGFVSNPIEVTDFIGIIESCGNDRCDRECDECRFPLNTIMFIQPKQVEEIEAVEFAEWLLNYYNKSVEGMALCWVNANIRIATKHTTKQLYEIFKN